MLASHVAELNRAAPDGTPQRDHWEASARGGNEAAIARLTPPEYPDCVEYLWRWVLELHGRSGIGMSGLAPLTYEAIAAWAALRGVRPTPAEVGALLAIDTALSASSSAERGAEATAADEEVKPQRPWPKRKPGVVPVFVKEAN